MTRVLTIIPAKGRSRRLPGKNIAMLSGKPLVVHAIEQAQDSGVCGDIVVSTDRENIALLARNSGAEVPFYREGDTDDITACGVAAYNVLHRLRVEFDRQYDVIGVLLTTSPMRTAEDIRGCYEVLVNNSGFDASMSFLYEEKHPYWAWTHVSETEMKPLFADLCDLTREESPKPYYSDGAVYFARTPFYESVKGDQYKGRVGGYYMEREHAVDVDTQLDLDFCEFLMSRKTSESD